MLQTIIGVSSKFFKLRCRIFRTIVMTVFSHWLRFHKVEVGTPLHSINYIKSGYGLLTQIQVFSSMT